MLKFGQHVRQRYDDQMIAQLCAESISLTDASTVRVATVQVQQSYTELACFRLFF